MVSEANFKGAPPQERPSLTNEQMEKIRAIRESTCIHGCYYVDTPNECIPPEENGIPNCKREIEKILEALEEQGHDRGLAELRAENESDIRVWQDMIKLHGEKMGTDYIALHTGRIHQAQEEIKRIDSLDKNRSDSTKAGAEG